MCGPRWDSGVLISGLSSPRGFGWGSTHPAASTCTLSLVSCGTIPTHLTITCLMPTLFSVLGLGRYKSYPSTTTTTQVPSEEALYNPLCVRCLGVFQAVTASQLLCG